MMFICVLMYLIFYLKENIRYIFVGFYTFVGFIIFITFDYDDIIAAFQNIFGANPRPLR